MVRNLSRRENLKGKEVKTMKKGLIIVAALLLTIGFASSSNAAYMESLVDIIFAPPHVTGDGEYVDHGWDAVNKLQHCTPGGLCDYVTWRHLFTPIAVDKILGAELAVRLKDDETDEWVNLETLEHGAIDGEGAGDYTYLGEINTGRYDGLAVDLTQLDDGEYEVTLWTYGGDFHVIAAQLAIDYIPEPSTLMLMGSGLIGLAFAARRKIRK